MPHSEHVERLLKAIGPFYEYVNEDSGSDENEDDDNNDDEEDEEVARNNTSGEDSIRIGNGELVQTTATTSSMVTSCIMVNSTASSVVEPLEYKPNGLVNKLNGSANGGGGNHVNGNHLKKQLNGDTSTIGLLNGSASSNDRDYPSGKGFFFDYFISSKSTVLFFNSFFFTFIY